jgi:isopentenyl-diphosphate delta-isomerase
LILDIKKNYNKLVTKGIMDEDHLIDIVDEQDKVIGQDSKENKFEKELISRNVVAFIKNGQGQLIIVKRSPKKRSWPNRLDLATCGNVNCGETYEEAINREIQEELGICCELQLIEKIYTEVIENDKKVRYFTGVYHGLTDQEPALCDELLELQYMSVKDISKMMDEEPDKFSPSFIRELKEFENYLSK